MNKNQFSVLYPKMGKYWCVKHFKMTEGQVRSLASILHLRLSHTSKFWKDFQHRAALSKTGRKRPDQSKFIKKMWEDGRFPKLTKKRKVDNIKRLKKWWRKNKNKPEYKLRCKTLWKIHTHPRGMLGKHHTLKTRKKMSENKKGNCPNWTIEGRKRINEALKKNMYYRIHTKKENIYSPAKRGWRIINRKKYFFRSRWEANYARYLQWLKDKKEIISWEYEPKTFWFEKIRRGVRSYTPDFLVTEKNGKKVWHEVKGWMDSKSKTKLKRMAKYYPKEKLIVIDGKYYYDIEKKIGRLIKNWEFKNE